MIYPRRSPECRGVRVVARPGAVLSADPVVRTTAATTTPDPAALAALAVALAAYGIAVGTVEEVSECLNASTRS